MVEAAALVRLGKLVAWAAAMAVAVSVAGMVVVDAAAGRALDLAAAE